ncbi:BAG family molecular chaperone regulator 4 [Hibiscus syriacus]|uniref:BAG family molecular chaperone regulator 4 n=1 Tax=Hibiscus syriacus TaxID=106335 RepID=A0A6A2WT12_HIBSY|nr:BAG family molecular chaperone regulator 4-like [Hibiscus syriacus]KAE8658655.1 BAG family molecular chaperone regulator 4 [Hibiscus syriacus]
MGIGASTPKTASGDLKNEIAGTTGLEPAKQRGFGKAGQTTASKENKVEFVRETEEMSKAFVAVDGVRKTVDKLSERVAALEVAVNSGTKVSDEEFDVSAELLMRELLKLDGIEAEGEAKLQRKAEVLRVQNFHETLDKLKTRNSKLS